MKERNKAVPAVFLILIRDNKILLGRRFGTGYFDGYYTLPSGHVEAGELPLDALLRETKEEIGIDINKNDAKLVHSMYRTKHDVTGDRADYFFLVDKYIGEPTNKEPQKCDDLKWFDLNNLPESIIPFVALALDNYKNNVLYSETPFDEKHLNPNK